MSHPNQVASFHLTQGAQAILARPPAPVCRHYYVLFVPGEPPSPEVHREVLALAWDTARRLSVQHYDDPACFTLIHNGPGPSRSRDLHIHILLVRTRAEKAAAYLRLFLKNVLGPLRPRYTPGPRG